MKYALLIALSLMVSIQARPPHVDERTVAEEIYDMNQIGKINATMINQVTMKVIEAERNAEAAINNLGEPYTYMEGKIQAAIIDIIYTSLKEAKAKADLLLDKPEVLDSDIEAIEILLEDVSTNIDQLN